MTIIKEFKQFLLRGNVVDLAVGVVIGAAFNSVVQAIVKDLLTPLITINFRNLNYLNLFNNIVSFFLVAGALFFFVVKPMNMLISRSRKEAPADPTTKKCKECLSEIPIQATRCAHCAQIVK